ncbi:acetyl-CoA carboxylase biotin carboxyl carrier protein [Chloracidobacterium validum]|uniref:Biotin carboxyl carrier protein of acetyl-CoA carboxylase n=1 Tax=Chloracidobacterium validum TaxID=2821543 RepID=A0ABX8BAQ9_9BACT|nr:acetyl-CoA carboxylase biotin carboxyl carrier protein [Chloracidobacterium validum]QUW03497.1 acetyl-CoA carboxylase biotin carboxyl carrier protein [Chloracidobacterium validum]
MNLKEIKELIEFVSEKQIAELEIDKAGLKLRIRTTQSVETTSSHLPTLSPTSISLPSGGTHIETQAPEKQEEDLYIVRSPIVGTFYRAPGPDAKPFVEVGTQVSSGTVLCIIEAMKLMNEVESDVSGEIVKIHQENGKPVEFGQPLFSVKRN